MTTLTLKQLKTKANLLKSKLDKAKVLTHILVKQTDKNFVPYPRYYRVLSMFNDIKKDLNNTLNQISSRNRENSRIEYNLPSNVLSREREERRAIREANVTTSTYERCRKNTDKQVNGFLTGK